MSAPIHPALKRFIWDIQSMVELTEDPREILFVGADLMARLIATDDWLPPAAATPEGPRQLQLYADEQERFCVVATAFGAEQTLPLLREPFWQILGVLRGAVTLEKIAVSDDGTARPDGVGRMLGAGAVERLSARSSAELRLSSGGAETAMVIQVYGGEIRACPRYVVAPNGRLQPVAFGYANTQDNPAYDIWSIQTKIED